MGTSVVVIGAGVIGLSIALQLAERDPSLRICVISPVPPENTTSSVAAAFWYPYAISGYYKSVWATDTLEHFRRLASEDATGVSIRQGFEYFTSKSDLERAKAPPSNVRGTGDLWWTDGIDGIDYRELRGDWSSEGSPIHREGDRAEIRAAYADPEKPERVRDKMSLRKHTLEAAVQFRVPIVQMDVYLTYLRDRCEAAGVSFMLDDGLCAGALPIIEDRLQEEEWIGVDDNIVWVNCAGAGAPSFAADQATADSLNKPAAGDVVHVRLPGDHQLPLVFIHNTGPQFDPKFDYSRYAKAPVYVVPRVTASDEYILGGTLIQKVESDDWYAEAKRRYWQKDSSPQPVADLIVERVAGFLPQFASKDREILGHYRGYRPRRFDRGIGGRDLAYQDYLGDGRSGVKVAREDVSVSSKTYTMVHCYGHGGGGVTLSWGSAAEACELVLKAAGTPGLPPNPIA